MFLNIKRIRGLKGFPLLLFFFLAVPPAVAIDPEGCLTCHRYEGLGRRDADGEGVHLYYVNPAYYDRFEGSHARLKCTDCHAREEVAVIPHQAVTPVNCTQSCHLNRSLGTEVHFAHDGISERLQRSVHDFETLQECNHLLGDPLRKDQALCLLCHDEPTYRRGDQSWSEMMAPVRRCNICHDETLPLNTQAFYWHVSARSQPAFSDDELIQLCDVCHGDQRVRNEFSLPNSVASYLTSFHGKASQLGLDSAANCLNCHTNERHDVHEMVSREDATSPINPDQVKDTCRSPRCHAQAGAKVSSAAVHLELATSRGIEFLIAALFVFMILATFGPSMVLMLLNMLQIVMGRHDPADHHYAKLAKKLKQNATGRKLLQRFTPFQRVQHWYLVVTFVTLALTGFPMKFADHAWAGRLIEMMGGLAIARLVHRVAGVLLVTGLFYHLVIYVGGRLIRGKRQTGKGWFYCIFALPLIMSISDFKKMGHYLGYLLFLRKTRPHWGRFSLEEKFEYFGVLWGSVLLGITGLLMWDAAWTSRHLPGRALTLVNLVHTFEAFLALLHVGIVHLAAVLLSPHVFPGSGAMFHGDTPNEELAEIHPELLNEVQARLNEVSLSPEGGHA